MFLAERLRNKVKNVYRNNYFASHDGLFQKAACFTADVLKSEQPEAKAGFAP